MQARFRIRAPGDALEQEADAVAATITRGEGRGDHGLDRLAGARAAPTDVLRQLDEDASLDLVDDEEDDDLIQAKPRAAGIEVSGEAADRISALRGGGRPMSSSERGYFEPRFGYDFGHVRIHAGAEAADLARSIGARAFTTGTDVVFGAGEHDTTSSAGRHLFAHELTHVVQQDTSRDAGAVQRDVIQRAPDDAPSIVTVVIYLKTGRIIATLSEGPQLVLILTRKESNLEPGDYIGEHTQGEWVDKVNSSTGDPLGRKRQWRFVHRDRKPRFEWPALQSGTYQLIVYGQRAEGTREEEIAAREAQKAAGQGTKGAGTGTKGTGEGDATGGTKGTGGGDKDKTGTGTGGSGDQQSETDVQKEARLRQFLDSLKKQGVPQGAPLDEATRKALLEMDPTQQEDLARYLRDSEDMADDSIDTNAEIRKFLEMSESDRELLRVNLELKKGATAGPLPEKVRIGLEQSAQDTAVGAKEAAGKLNEQLVNLAAIHRTVTHDTLIDQEGASLEPIELERLPVFREMMMLEGLMAGAATKSPEIETAAKDLTKSIAGIRDYVLEEIMWLAGEMAATAVIGALLGPIGTAGAAVRGTMLLKRLNSLRKFLQKVEKVYSTYTEIDGIIKKVVAGYEQYKIFRPQFDTWVADLDALKTALEDPDLDDAVAEATEEKLEALENRVIDELYKQLESDKGLGAVLEFFDIPADADDEALKEILFNIPRGVDELKRLKTLYDTSGRDFEATKKLAYRAVLVGALLYPFVGFLTKEIGTRLQNLMPEKDLGDRLLDVIGHATAGRRKYTRPGKQQSQARLKKARKTKDQTQVAADKAKKAERRKQRDAARKKADEEKRAEEEKDKKRTQKEKDEAKASGEWEKVVKKVATLERQHKEKGATQGKLKSQAKAIKRKHKKVAGTVSVKAVADRGEWEVVIQRKGGTGTARAVVPMGYNERWERGKEAVEAVVVALPADQRTKAGVESRIAPLKDKYQYASLTVHERRERHRSGLTVLGAMGKVKDREITNVDDLTGLHTGEQSDPIPIYWYKDPSWYPGSSSPLKLTIDGKPQDFWMTKSSAEVTLKDGATVKIGVDQARLVTPGTTLKRHSKHDRDYSQTDKLKDALKTAGYSDWVRKDIDHVTDLAFEGTNSFSNLWPLDSGKNRWAYTGRWYKQYGIEYLDKKTPGTSKVSTLYKLQHKWFRTLKGYRTTPETIGGRTKPGTE